MIKEGSSGDPIKSRALSAEPETTSRTSVEFNDDVKHTWVWAFAIVSPCVVGRQLDPPCASGRLNHFWQLASSRSVWKERYK